MRLSEIPHTLFPVRPPPLWYVTNGELTVGPVVTGLLMRGVEYGRVPDYCCVRPYRGNWRELLGVREISALHRKLDAQAGSAQTAEWQRAIAGIRDEDELCHTVTWIAMLATSAESGMFHFRGRSSRTLVTRAVVGPLPKDRLGYPLPEDDLLLRAARQGKPVTGPPYGATEDALAMRFAYSRGGAGAVAMIPVFAGGSLSAMLELSRPGHAFRRQDLQTAERLVQRALYQRAN
jgi:hypothetical protein